MRAHNFFCICLETFPNQNQSASAAILFTVFSTVTVYCGCVGCGAKNDSEVPSGESFFATLNGINPKSIKIMEI